MEGALSLGGAKAIPVAKDLILDVLGACRRAVSWRGEVLADLQAGGVVGSTTAAVPIITHFINTKDLR
jgi:hypothetical protein